MASEDNHPTYAFPDLDEDDDDDTEEDDLEHPTKRQQDMDDDDGDEDDDEDEDTSSSNLATGGEAIVLPSSSSKVTVAVAGDPAVSVAQTVTIALPASDFTPDPKRQRIEGVPTAGIEKGAKPLAVFDESRRLFQRLWTDEDEIEILQGFLDYTKQRGNLASHHQDTSAFYDLIRSKLQLDFNKSQLVEKLRRLKKKYRNILSKIGPGKNYLFKTQHEHATFEICRRIWSAEGNNRIGGGGYDYDETNPNNPNPHANSVDRITNGLDANSSERKASKSRKRSKGPEKMEEKPHFPQFAVPSSNPSPTPNPNPTPTPPKNTATPFPNLIEETVRSCLSPLFNDLIQGNMNSPGSSRGGFLGVAMNSMPFGLWSPSASFLGGGDVMEEKWRKQQILELEVYSKRLELVQDQIKTALEELRSPGS